MPCYLRDDPEYVASDDGGARAREDPRGLTVPETAFFVLTIPFAVAMALGDILAAPLEKHRHSTFAVWLLWNMVRLGAPWAIVSAVVVFAIRKMIGR